MDPSARPEFWLDREKAADIVVIGEGERTFPELLERLSRDPAELSDIPGIAFKKDGQIMRTDPRKLLTPDELNSLPNPVYDSQLREGVKIGTVEQERGCPYPCTFCAVWKFYGRTVRNLSPDAVERRMRAMSDYPMGKRLFFSGDNLFGNMAASTEMLEFIASSPELRKIPKYAQVSVAAAKFPGFLDAARRANINYLYIGFESMNPDTLKALGKVATPEDNERAARTFREYGFGTHGMFMFGLDHDTPKTTKETMAWAKSHVDTMQLFPETPLP
jgi:radical SAM superfamily enzyme YgiQ (UPF0313 family)